MIWYACFIRYKPRSCEIRILNPRNRQHAWYDPTNVYISNHIQKQFMLKFQTCIGFSTCCLIAYRVIETTGHGHPVAQCRYSRSSAQIFRHDDRYTMHVQNSVCSTVRYQYTGGVYMCWDTPCIDRPLLLLLFPPRLNCITKQFILGKRRTISTFVGILLCVV
jgi:hypothetical protein